MTSRAKRWEATLDACRRRPARTPLFRRRPELVVMASELRPSPPPQAKQPASCRGSAPTRAGHTRCARATRRDKGAGGGVRLGVDPAGGTVPGASTILWITGDVDDRSADLCFAP